MSEGPPILACNKCHGKDTNCKRCKGTGFEPEFPYENAALRVTVEGWSCATCGHFWGRDEHMARWCCAKTVPCSCGARMEKTWTLCEACRAAKALATWLSFPEVEWDGEFPITIWDNDVYFWDGDQLADWIGDALELNGVAFDVSKLEPFWFCHAEVGRRRSFDMSDYFSDDFATEHGTAEPNFARVERLVEKWLDKNAPKMYQAANKRIPLAQIFEMVKEAFESTQPEG